MGLFDSWRKKHDVAGNTPIGDLSEDARLDLLQAMETESAEAGDAESMFELARLLEHRGDPEGARSWYAKAEAAGHNGQPRRITPQQMEEFVIGAARHQAASRADPADVEVAHMNGLRSESIGMVDDALKWHHQAADAGHLMSAFRLAFIYGQQGDDQRAIRWYLVTAASGDRDSMYNLGNKYMNVGNKPEALKWYTKAAEAGDTDAMVKLGGDHMQNGRPEEALRWYSTATRAGVSDAVVVSDFLSRALSGDSDAMASLGDLMKASGNDEQATAWFRRAADAGHDNAVLALGNLIGGAALMEWVRSAYEQGNPAARRLVRSLREEDERLGR